MPTVRSIPYEYFEINNLDNNLLLLKNIQYIRLAHGAHEVPVDRIQICDDRQRDDIDVVAVDDRDVGLAFEQLLEQRVAGGADVAEGSAKPPPDNARPSPGSESTGYILVLHWHGRATGAAR